jgi:hypothetical protein
VAPFAPFGRGAAWTGCRSGFSQAIFSRAAFDRVVQKFVAIMALADWSIAMTCTTRRAFLASTVGAIGCAAVPLSFSAAHAPVTDDTARFLDLVRRGELEAVRAMLASDPSLRAATDDVGRSAFGLAFLHGHPQVGAVIRSHGYEPDLHESALALDWDRFAALGGAQPELVNAPHPIGGSAMVAAAMGGAGSDIWRVYSQTGDPNVRPAGRLRPSALRAAIEFADLARAEMTSASLLANGAQSNAREPEGRTALHVAAARGSRDITEMLIRKGAAVDALDQQGRTPIDLARAGRHVEVVRLLDKHADVPRDHNTSRYAYDAQGKPYRAPALDSIDIMARCNVVGAAHTQLEKVREAVNNDARLAHSVATTTEGAVEACAHTGQRPIVEFLLSHGAPYSLLTATMMDDKPRMRALLQEDPLRIHERGPHDFALLWYPIIGECSLDCLELLINAGAEIERHHHLGTTALHFAALAGATEHAEWLLEHSADVNRIGRKFSAEGDTPMQLAQRRGHTEMEALLRKHGGRG